MDTWILGYQDMKCVSCNMPVVCQCNNWCKFHRSLNMLTSECLCQRNTRLEREAHEEKNKVIARANNLNKLTTESFDYNSEVLQDLVRRKSESMACDLKQEAVLVVNTLIMENKKLNMLKDRLISKLRDDIKQAEEKNAATVSQIDNMLTRVDGVASILSSRKAKTKAKTIPKVKPKVRKRKIDPLKKKGWAN